jgi:F-type H+-transporting ATPase subunit gamma
MASLIDLRRRIRAVRNMQQITGAMKMISAARLRRAQDRVIAARPYSQMLRRFLENVAAAVSDGEEAAANPLLARRPEERIELLVLTADRGLAGAFSSNVIKAVQKFIGEHRNARVDLQLMGRKGRDFFRRRHEHISGDYAGLFLRTVEYDQAISIARKVMQRFIDAEIDAVYLIGNEFKSIATQVMTVIRLLPVDMPQTGERISYIYEQPPSEILEELLPRYVEMSVYRAMLESSAAEHAARMTAMDAASSNAAEMIDNLTLHLNRVRQASITKEIIEIVSGAAALG